MIRKMFALISDMLIADLELKNARHVTVKKVSKGRLTLFIRGKNNFSCNEFRVIIARFFTFYIFYEYFIMFVSHNVRYVLLVDSKYMFLHLRIFVSILVIFATVM
jgi:hypothetical protein